MGQLHTTAWQSQPLAQAVLLTLAGYGLLKWHDVLVTRTDEVSDSVSDDTFSMPRPPTGDTGTGHVNSSRH